jgi:type II secretory pathway pseudopilin PulG
MKKIAIVIVAIVLTVSAAGTGLAQQSQDLKQLKKQIELLQERQAEIQKELKEIKSLLQALQQAVSAKPQEVILNVESLPFKGDKNARLTIVEFSDYQ